MFRREFLTALGLGALTAAAPKYGRWHQQGSGVLVRDVDNLWTDCVVVVSGENVQIRRVVGYRGRTILVDPPLSHAATYRIVPLLGLQ